MIGKTILHYKILEELGRGGMGVVYKALDTKLGRSVALKFLRIEALEEQSDRTRFIREAQAAAVLDHPNICTVYEVGEADDHAYISMAYIQGQSLKERIASGPVPLSEALDYALQAAEGLRAAHEKGIVHRDIKSSNLMLTPAGGIKVMDFGLAKTTGATKVTKTGTMLGTIAYMSPEQVLAHDLDRRSDLWSLGVVLYELLAGRLPFAGEYDPAVLYSILNERQEPLTEAAPGTPLEVERLVDRMLEKDPEKRYGSAEELIAELRGLRETLDLLPKRSQLQLRILRQRRRIISGAVVAAVVLAAAVAGIRYFSGTARAIDSIAVLPFVNLSNQSGDEIIAEGIMRDLTAVLSQVSGLGVISSNSMMMYKDRNMTPRHIASEVKAKALIEGTIKRFGDKLELSIEMIDGRTEEILWSHSDYEIELRDIERLFNEIAMSILGKAGINLTPQLEARFAKSYTVDTLAYRKCLEAKYFAGKWTEDGFRKALALYREAADIDPLYARIWAGMAQTYVDLGWWSYIAPKEASAKGTAAANKALELDDSQAEAYAALGWIKFQFDWNYWGAEGDFRRAVELKPNDADIVGSLADYLMFTDRFDEGLKLRRKAVELDPLTLTVSTALGWGFYYAGRYNDSIAQLNKSIELDPTSFYPHMFLAWNYAKKGMSAEAVAACDSAMSLARDLDDPFVLANCASVYAQAGRRDIALQLLDTILARAREEYVNPVFVALVYLGLGDNEKVLEWLERGYEAHAAEMIVIDDDFRSLRGDPRYLDLLRRIGIPMDEGNLP